MGFNAAVYQRELQGMTVPQLRKQESKCQNKIGGYGAVTGAGVGLAFFTLGASLIGSGYGAYKMDSAHDKLKLVRAELARRDEEACRVRDMVKHGAAVAVSEVANAVKSEMIANAANQVCQAVCS